MFHNHPVVGKIDVVCNFLGKSHLVGNEDAGHPFLGEFLDGDQDLFHRLGIKGRGDLVKSITSGFIARDRAIATRCCCPPESSPG